MNVLIRLNLCALLLLVFGQSCTKKVDIPLCPECDFNCFAENEPEVVRNDCLDNWDCEFRVVQSASVGIDEFEGVTEGDKTVFQMIMSTEGDVNIIDDEFTSILVLELDPMQESFSVSDNELSKINLNYRRLCFCPATDFYPIEKGCLQGERQNNGSWFLHGKLQAPEIVGDFEVIFEAEFVN